jgi:hypothetical protein
MTFVMVPPRTYEIEVVWNYQDADGESVWNAEHREVAAFDEHGDPYVLGEYKLELARDFAEPWLRRVREAKGEPFHSGWGMFRSQVTCTTPATHGWVVDQRWEDDEGNEHGRVAPVIAWIHGGEGMDLSQAICLEIHNAYDGSFAADLADADNHVRMATPEELESFLRAVEEPS